MANYFSTATLGLGVDTKDFIKDFGITATKTEQFLASMKLSADAFHETWHSLTAGLKDTKRIVSGILISRGFYALMQTIQGTSAAILDFSKNMETAAVSMEYFVKGAEKAAKAQAFLREMNLFAARTPFITEEALALSRYVQAVGISMNTTKSFLQVITDTAAATGATQENLQRIVFGLGQMMTKGRIANEEIRQLANANIPIYEILQEQLGLTGEQIANIGKYWIPADKAIVAILRGLEQRYKGAADRISETVTGMTDTIVDNFKIIAQEATKGLYKSLVERMGTIRDMLDRYREIATEQGSFGLFDQILRDIDSSGQIGTLIIALIGHFRQLGSAIKELYISAQPIIKLFGMTFYTTVVAVSSTLTGFSKVLTGVMNGLNKLGITSGHVAKVLASLYIAYKAGTWVAFLGQGAIAAAQGLWQTISAMTAILPASLRASAGMRILTASLIGLLTYGLAVWGVFKALNASLAGLDTTTSGGNLFPDDYTRALEEYQQKMDEYNAKIAQYQKDFQAPYTAIDEGVDMAEDSFEKIEKASKKASKAVKDHWLATFDEVYSPPKDYGAGSGLGDLLDDMQDLGALLIPPFFKFPSRPDYAEGLEPPTMPFKDIFKGSLWEDNEVLDSGWWKKFIPFALVGLATQLGKTLATNRAKETEATTGPGTGGKVDPFMDVKDAATALKESVKQFGKVEKQIAEFLKQLHEGTLSSEEAIVAYKKLEMQVEAALKLQEKINQYNILTNSTALLESLALKDAQKMLLEYQIKQLALVIDDLKVAAADLGDEGNLARIELQKALRALEKLYIQYLELGDVDELIKQAVVKHVSISGTPSSSLDPFQDSTAALFALQEQVVAFNEMQKKLQELLDLIAISSPTEVEKLYEKLALQVETAQKLFAKIEKLQTIANVDDLITSNTLLEARQAVLINRMERLATRIANLQETAESLGIDGSIARIEIRRLTGQLKKTYTEYLLGGGSATAARAAGGDLLDTNTIIDKINTVNTNVAAMRTALMENGFKASDVRETIEITKRLIKDIEKVIDIAEQGDATLNENLRLLEHLDSLLTNQLKLAEMQEELTRLREIVATWQAREEMGQRVDLHVINERIATLEESIQKLTQAIAYDRSLVSAGTSQDAQQAMLLQTIIDNRNAFRGLSVKLDAMIGSVLRPLKAIEKYNSRLMLEFESGRRVIKQGIQDIRQLIKFLPEEARAILEPYLRELESLYVEALKSETKPTTSFETMVQKLELAIQELGVLYGVNQELVTGAINSVTDAVNRLDGTVNVVEEHARKISQRADERAKQEVQEKKYADERDILEWYQDELEKAAESATSLKEFLAAEAKARSTVIKVTDEAAKRQHSLLAATAKREGREIAPFDPSTTFYVRYKDRMDEIAELAREDFEDPTYSGKTIKPFIEETSKGLTAAERKLREFGEALTTFKDNILGPTIRGSAAFLPETAETPYLQNLLAGYISPHVVEAGLFDPRAAALKTSDIAAMFGQSGYGKTIFSVLTGLLDTNVRLANGIILSHDTFHTIIQKIIGQVSVTPILLAAAEKLKAAGFSLQEGATFYNKERTLSGNLKGIVFNQRGGLRTSLETVTLSNFTTKLMPILEKYATFNNGIYKLTAAGFNELVAEFGDIAYELAGNSVLLNKQTVYLAALDKNTAGLNALDFSDLNKYNIADPKQRAHVMQEINRRVSQYVVDNMGQVQRNVAIIEVRIPVAFKRTIEEAIDQFNFAINKLSQLYAQNLATGTGPNLREMLLPFNKLGETLGPLTAERYLNEIYSAPKLGSSTANQMMAEVMTDLKSTNAVIRETATQTAQDLVDRMVSAAYQTGLPADAYREVVLGTTNTGQLASIKDTGANLLVKAAAIETVLGSIDSRTSSIATAVGDLVHKYNIGAEKGLRMEDPSGHIVGGKEVTMRSLGHLIAQQEQQFTSTGNLQKQLQESLFPTSSNRQALPITNYNQYATAAEYAQYLGGLVSEMTPGTPDAGTDLKTGLTVSAVFPEAAKKFQEMIENWTSEYSTSYLDWIKAYEEAGAANAAALAASSTSELDIFRSAIAGLDPNKMYSLTGVGTLKGSIFQAKLESFEKIAIADATEILDETGNIIYSTKEVRQKILETLVEPNAVAAYLGRTTTYRSPGIGTDWFRAGRYVGVDKAVYPSNWYTKQTGTAGTSYETGTGGVYFQFGEKTVDISGSTLSNVLGALGIALSIGQIASSTAKDTKAFEEFVLPALSATEQKAAEERAKKMGITGWTSGAGGGQLATRFLEQYGEMTPTERLYWGQVTAAKSKPDFNIFGQTDYSTLKNALDDVFSSGVFGPDIKDYADQILASDIEGSRITAYMDERERRKDISDVQLLTEALERGVTESPLAALTDYIVMSGDTSSKIALEFYKRYGDYMDTIIKPAYGVDETWLKAVDVLLSSTNEQAKAFIDSLSLGGLSADAVPMQYKEIFDTIIEDLQTSFQEQLLPVLQLKRDYDVGDGTLAGGFSRVIEGLDLSGMSEATAKQLEDTLGISFEQLADGFGALRIDSEAISDNIMGWVTRLPDTISLDGANLSAQDVAILAQAGIQVNGDGTVTFMKAMNENVTGTTRTTGLTEADLSANIIKQFAAGGLTFDFSGLEASFDLSVDIISKKMKSALYTLGGIQRSEVNTATRKALAGLGEILDSGYIKITNEAVLSGKMTIEEYLKSIGSSIDDISPELILALENIDGIITSGGERTRETIAQMADGIVVPSLIDEDHLTDEIRAAFATVGITFENSGEELLMVINRLGNHIKDGMVLIPAETWKKLDDDIIDGLEKLGVKMTEEAGFVMVDVSGVMEKGAGEIVEIFTNRPDLWDLIPESVRQTLEDAGIYVDEGLVKINLSMTGGMTRFGNEWYSYWEGLEPDVIDAMGASHLATDGGILKIEKVLEDTVIPDNVEEYIVKPFDELPETVKDRLTGGDKSVKKSLEGSEVLITSATEDLFVGAINATETAFGNMVTLAEGGATDIANAVANAIAEANKLNKIEVSTPWKPFESAKKKETVQVSGVAGNYTVRYQGVTYSSIPAMNETEAIEMLRKQGFNIPTRAYGGLITEDGLYRAGEFGKTEGIIPLENKAGLRVIGDAIASQMNRSASPVQTTQLQNARYLSNAGVVLQTAFDMLQAMQSMSQPQLQYTQPVDQKPTMYVHTLIADKQGLRELEKKLSVVRLEN